MEIACRAFIFYKDKLLLCKQKTPQRDFWTLPGGNVEVGETLPDCVSREISEELSIELEADQMLFIRELIDQPRHRIEFYFSIKKPTDMIIFDQIHPHNEIEELRFFSIEDLSTIAIKPKCLPGLIRMINDKKSIFPRYLGNVT